jgi:P27 family predicted phage terminase small subunit
VLARIDRAALELYCTIYARWRAVEARLSGSQETPAGLESWVVTTESGYETMTVYLTIANKCITQMKQLLTEFGATPSSRARVRMEQPKEEESLADKLRKAVG